MLKELLKSYRIVQYGLKVRTQVLFGAFFGIFGIAMEVVTRGKNIIGSFYIILAGMFIYQLIISSDMSTLVQSSPHKKKIQCVYPLISIIPWIYVCITILAVINGYFAGTSSEAYIDICRMTAQLSIILFLSIIYFPLSYKYFVVATVALFVTVWPAMLIVATDNFISAKFTDYGVCVVILYLSATIGLIISFFVSRLVYKKDLSKIAFMGLIKRK
ncbi:MAG: hypothetical protein K5662_08285 [Lachnospiraceae bacterium]|nr:hypothetical protein [Lachnospiraceae bacterium]